MDIRSQFMNQWAKVQRTEKRLAKAEHNYHMRERGYKEEGIPFNDRTREKLQNTIAFQRQRLAKQSVRLLQLHDALANAADLGTAFDRSQYEKSARG